MTPATITDRLAAMTHKIGDLFSDSGLMLMIVGQDRGDVDGEMYWICDDISGESSGFLWYRDEYVTEGKQELVDRLKEK